MATEDAFRDALGVGDNHDRRRASGNPAGPDHFDGEQLEVEDRRALQRVDGFSTELRDVSEVEYRRLRLERVVLIGVWTSGTAQEAEHSLTELKLLAQTAGCEVAEGLVQRRDTPDPATYVGSGKARELRDIAAATDADTVICDGELTPSQLRQLEDTVKVKVIDRSALILDIFAQHARSREGKAQVELAQLRYLLPRLRGWGEALSRTGGGIGTRGPGETKIEVDRRRIRNRITRLRKEIAGMDAARETKRSRRQSRQIPTVAIAGYTNAGKSSVLNRLTGAGVMVQDSLFATLDPTVRRARTPDGRICTLADTVGFVRHLPHQLIDAFRSTLEEVADADLIVHVVDGSHPEPEVQIASVREVFDEIGASDVPEIMVINKVDIADGLAVERLRRREPRSLAVSAQAGSGFDGLLGAIERELPRPGRAVHALVPYRRGDLLSRVHEHGQVLAKEHTAEGTRLHAQVPPALAAELDTYAVARV